MANVKMSKVRIVGLKSERNLILNVLERSGSFEVVPTKEIGTGAKVKDVSHLDKVVGKQAKLGFAIDFLNSVNSEVAECIASDIKKHKKDENYAVRDFDYTPAKKTMGRKQIGYDDFYDVAAKEYELLTVADALEKLSFERVEIKSQINKINIINKNLKPYENADIKFSQLRDTKCACVMLALGPKSSADPLGGIECYTEEYPSVGGCLLGIVGKKEDKQKIIEKLSLAGFSLCTYSYDALPKEVISRNEDEIKGLIARDEEKLRVALSYTKYLDQIKVLYDVMGLEIEKSLAELEFVKTDSTFVAEGWTPAQNADNLVAEIKKQTEKVVCVVTAPEDGDAPPTLAKNPKLIAPFEDVTNMYAVPSYNEIDPNPFMSFFFFVFFGIMLGDAGYGLVLSILCFVALKLFKFEKGLKNMVFMFAICGISGVIWGLLFGGIFAIETIPALWFNPLQEPIMMLAVSIVLGVIHLCVGYGLNMAAKIKDGKIADAVLDNVFIFTIFIGVALLALNMLLKPESGALGDAGLYVLIGSLVCIALTAGRHNKGIGGKFAGGFAGIYNLINLFSDVMSYARLFGLALASGAIGLAFNSLGSMFFTIPVIGYVIGIIVLIPLHAFNMGLSLLSAYVHNIRLQYLEFYGKFFEGNGRLFTPLGEKTKYVRFI